MGRGERYDMWARLSLRTKLTVLVVSVVSIASWTFGRFAFQGVLGLLEKSSGLGAVTTAEVLADAVDAAWFRSINPSLGTDSVHAQLQERFTRLVSEGRVYRVHVVRFLDQQYVEHILSVPVDRSADYRPPGERERLQPDDVYAEKSSGFHGVELSTPGAFMGGWAPIKYEGRPLGLVVVAIDGSETQNALDTIYIAIASTMVAFILLSGLIAYKFALTFEKTAVTDGLMGIYNHKHFKQRLEDEVAKSRRYGQQTSLVLLDIDFFKRVNDTYGHATGDIVLKNLAKWVLDSARTTDVVARYGGEEIAVILPHTGLAGAQEFAERLRMKVSHQVVRDPEENAEFRVTVSIGVAQWEKGMDMHNLIKHADTALYHSKHTGRNRVSIYQEDLLPGSTQPSVLAKR